MVNAKDRATDTCSPQGLGAVAAQVRALSHVGDVALRDWPVGPPNTYRAIALRESSNDAPDGCFANPNGDKPRSEQIPAKSFGKRRAPSTWVQL